MDHASWSPPPNGPSSAIGWAHLTERLNVCSRLLGRTLDDQLQHVGAGNAHFWLLWACSGAPPEGVGQSQLAEMLALSPAHVSSSVEQLREAGLLVGRRHADDRRKQVWNLTPAGQVALAKSVRQLKQWAQDLESRFGAEQRARFLDLISELIGELQGAGRDYRVDPPQCNAPTSGGFANHRESVQ